MNYPVLMMEDVGRSYSRRINDHIEKIHALDSIHCTIRENEMVVLTGHSGAGKTTFLNLAAALEQPTEGTIHVNDTNLNTMSQKERARFRNRTLGYMLQFYCLPTHLTAEEHIMLPLIIGGEAVARARERAMVLLKALELQSLAKAYPHHLSGGQAQRIALARALANRPRILLADEPTGNLDTRTAEQILDLLTHINLERGITMILVTHDENMIQTPHRRIRLEAGRIVTDDIITP